MRCKASDRSILVGIRMQQQLDAEHVAKRERWLEANKPGYVSPFLPHPSPPPLPSSLSSSATKSRTRIGYHSPWMIWAGICGIISTVLSETSVFSWWEPAIVGFLITVFAGKSMAGKSGCKEVQTLGCSFLLVGLAFFLLPGALTFYLLLILSAATIWLFR